MDRADADRAVRPTRRRTNISGGLIKGELIGAHGINTEAEAGSDVMALRHHCDARRRRLCAERREGVLAPTAGRRRLRDLRHRRQERRLPGLHRLAVERDTPGLIVSENRKKMVGLRTSPMAWLTLRTAAFRSPHASARKARAGGSSTTPWRERAPRSWPILVGAMEHQVEECIRHANKRTQFRKPIGKFQSVSNRIVDMKPRHETSLAAALQGRLAEEDQGQRGDGGGARQAL
ncbi:MAG: hypothetical protein HPM95_02685 [Alphaproteobacteria bacterium]|nr:hypothetical protein [Alphaproteobacteria bacterium]